MSDMNSGQIALNRAILLFNDSRGLISPIYNGPEYYFYSPSIKGNAYFQDVIDFTAGSVYYDGALCTGVPMIYDLNTDKVVVLSFDHFTLFSLIGERVKSFDFLSHHFININTDTIVNNDSGLKSGFYDQVYHGKTEVLVKRLKRIQEIAGNVERHFRYASDFYIKKDGRYYKCGNQTNVLEILKDKRKELQQYIRSSRIKFRKNPEEAMVKIVSYYDQLAN